MFGEFNCLCGNTWSSGYAWMEWDNWAKKWVNNWQKCRRCRKEVFPATLQPLKYTGGNASQKPHDSANCEMCQKYGDCRNIIISPAVAIEEEDWDDSASIRSEASSISDISEDRYLSNGTPVNSDEEAIDDLLSSKLKGLHM